MCYLIAKNKNVHGCIALKTRHGSHLVEMKRRMNQQVALKGIQLVTISRPTAYGEYAPYTFIEDEKEVEKMVQKIGESTSSTSSDTPPEQSLLFS